MILYTPTQLLIDQLRDLTSTASQLAKAWPELISLTTHPNLKALLTRHNGETRSNVLTLYGILEEMHVKFKVDRCQAMEGLLKGGKEHLMQVPYDPLRDLMMIAHSMRVEGYEIVAHEFTLHLANTCGNRSVAERLSIMLAGHAAMKRDLQTLQGELFATANQSEAPARRLPTEAPEQADALGKRHSLHY